MLFGVFLRYVGVVYKFGISLRLEIMIFIVFRKHDFESFVLRLKSWLWKYERGDDEMRYVFTSQLM